MVVDFHLHCYDRPLRAPESFVAFMDRELAKSHGSFAKFLERYGSMEIAGLPPRRLLTYFPDLERVSDKVLFGSDWPSVPTMKGNIDAIRALALSEGAKERILGGNAARLLKLL